MTGNSIFLKNDIISIEVRDSNPIHKALSKFIGETLDVVADGGEERAKVEVPRTPKPIPQETEAVTVNIAGYLEKLDKIFIAKSIVKHILKTHALRFFGASESTKSGVYAAVLGGDKLDYKTLVRVIDNEVVYLTVHRDFVRSV